MPTKEINDACKELQEAWDQIKNEYFKRYPGHYLILTCVYRSPEEQMADFSKGRTQSAAGTWLVTDKNQVVTNADGVTVLGPHNYHPSRAIDVAVVDNQSGKVVWEEVYYLGLLEIAKGLNLESGGEWKSLKDWPHIQVRSYKTYLD